MLAMVIGLILLGVIVISALILGSAKNNGLKTIAYIIICLCTFALFYSERYLAECDYKEGLAREVNMKQVTVSGISMAKGEVEFIYKKGKLDQVKLIPGTTKSTGMGLPDTTTDNAAK